VQSEVLGEPIADAIRRARTHSRSDLPQQVFLLRHCGSSSVGYQMSDLSTGTVGIAAILIGASMFVMHQL
jgi:hypothetical protein